MSRSRGRAAVTGLGALLALAVVVIGLPVLLLRLGGSPLPSHVRLGGIGRALLHRDSTSVVLAAVRDITWLAWALFTLAVLAEAQAVARRRTPPRLWLGGLQGAAGRLVALAALTFTAAPVGTLLATPQPIATVLNAVPQADVMSLSAATAPAPVHAQTTALQQQDTPAGFQGEGMGFFQLVTVHPGDCLWTIAQHYLGHGDLYTQIVQLNQGHDMGGGEVFSDPGVIQPGWVLQLPGGPAVAPPANGTPAGQPGSHTGHSGSGGQFGQPHQSATPAPAPSSAPAAASTAPAPAPASAPASAPARPAPGPAASAPGGTAPGTARTIAPASAEATIPADSRLPLFVAFGTGVLAGGAAVSLARLRHRQRQTRRRGRRIPLPASAPVIEAERRLHVAADQEPVTALRGVLSSLAAALVTRPTQMPDITALVVRPDSLEVLLASPAAEPPPAPFTVLPGRQGMAWQLWLDGEPPSVPDNVGDLLPGLLTVGTADGGYLLVDLEHLQVTAVTGPPAMTAEMLRSAAAELATGQLAGWYDLILVGFPELAALGGRGSCCDTLDAGLDLLAAKAVALRRRLGESPLADVRYHRLADPADEDWALTLLVSAVPPTAGQLALLADLSGDPGGIAALVPGGPQPPGGHRPPAQIELAAGPVGSEELVARVWPLQLEACPQGLDDADYEALTSLFVIAAGAHDVGPADPPYDSWTWPPDLGNPEDAGFVQDSDIGDDTGEDDVSNDYRGDGGLDDPGLDDGEDDAGHPATARLGDTGPDDTGLTATARDDTGLAGTGLAGTGLAGTGLAGTGLAGGTGLAADLAAHWAAPNWSGTMAVGADWAAGRDPAPAPAAVADAAGGEVRDETEARGEPGADAGDGLAEPDPAVTGLPGEPAAWLQDPAPAPAPAAQAPDSPQEPEARPEAGQQSLRIGVLGTFTINGQPGALLPAQSQLVLALALNGTSGLSNQQLCYLLGADPDRPKPSDSLRQLIVRTRRQLGRAPDRREWIEHLGGGQYALHPAARFDWHEFDALATEGMRARDPHRLRRALGLIRGHPFTGCYYWWLDLALTETVRAQIVDAADVLAGLELADGNAAAAARAARIGLTGDPGAEQLWRALMRAEHAAGNLSGVREAWSRCLDAISEIAPDGEPHPGTAALYRELLGDAPARAAWAGG